MNSLSKNQIFHIRVVKTHSGDSELLPNITAIERVSIDQRCYGKDAENSVYEEGQDLEG